MPKGNKSKKGAKKAPRTKVIIRKQKKSRKPKRTAIGGLIRVGGKVAEKVFGMPGLGEVGAQISRAFGQGDYTLARGNQNDVVPRFGGPMAGCRIRHREFIRVYSTSTTFSNNMYRIQPSNDLLFPWLSGIAVQFEQYKVHGMIFALKTTSATAVSSTNTALGVIGAVINYDPTDPKFSTRQECENYEGCVSAVPAMSQLCGFEAKKALLPANLYYVRNSETISDEDLKFYDVGTFQLFSDGAQAASTAGEFWVTYDIEFFRPKLAEDGGNLKSCYLATTSSGTYNITSALSQIGPSSGDLACEFYQNNIGFPQNNLDAYYLVDVGITITSQSMAPPTVSNPAGFISCTPVTVLWGGFSQYSTPSGAVTTTRLSNMLVLKVAANTLGAYITYVPAAFTGAGATFIIVTQIDSKLVTDYAAYLNLRDKDMGGITKTQMEKLLAMIDLIDSGKLSNLRLRSKSPEEDSDSEVIAYRKREKGVRQDKQSES